MATRPLKFLMCWLLVAPVHTMGPCGGTFQHKHAAMSDGSFNVIKGHDRKRSKGKGRHAPWAYTNPKGKGKKGRGKVDQYGGQYVRGGYNAPDGAFQRKEPETITDELSTVRI